MTDHPDPCLPGLGPSAARFTLVEDPSGYWSLRIATGDSLGALHAPPLAHYEALTLGEALDVIDAVISGWEPPPGRPWA